MRSNGIEKRHGFNLTGIIADMDVPAAPVLRPRRVCHDLAGQGESLLACLTDPAGLSWRAIQDQIDAVTAVQIMDAHGSPPMFVAP